MPPIVVDPATYDKNAAWNEAEVLCREFLTLNQIPHPHFVPEHGPIRGKWKDFGVYLPRISTVFVNIKKSRPPTKMPGFSWSYTGYKADLTVPGILAHEVGHHTHWMLGVKWISADVRSIFRLEPRVSSYEPSPEEAFAEAMRLFIINPSLLCAGREARWRYITEILQLRPTHDLQWREVLKNAHSKFIAAAEQWIKL